MPRKITGMPHGRPALARGKTIVPSVSRNLRRAGSHGYKSTEIILGHPMGIAYEEYLKLGGRSKDLNEMVELAHVTLQ